MSCCITNICSPKHCSNGKWAQVIIDCAEQMGVPCNGQWTQVQGECCSKCVETPVKPSPCGNPKFQKKYNACMEAECASNRKIWSVEKQECITPPQPSVPMPQCNPKFKKKFPGCMKKYCKKNKLGAWNNKAAKNPCADMMCKSMNLVWSKTDMECQKPQEIPTGIKKFTDCKSAKLRKKCNQNLKKEKAKCRELGGKVLPKQNACKFPDKKPSNNVCGDLALKKCKQHKSCTWAPKKKSCVAKKAKTTGIIRKLLSIFGF